MYTESVKYPLRMLLQNQRYKMFVRSPRWEVALMCRDSAMRTETNCPSEEL